MKLLLLLLLLAGCSNTDFPKVEEVIGFRIVAIEADNSEVAPGAATNVRLFIADPVGAGRTVNFTYEACIDPGVGVGAEVKCDHDASAASGNLNVDTSLLGTMNTGATANVGVTVPATILAGRSSIEQFNGVGYLVIFTATVDGQEFKAFKRILGTNRGGTLNTNPSITQVQLNGAVLAATKPQKSDALNVIADTPESYQAILVDGTTENREEEYQVAWYVSKGEFDKPKARVGESVEYRNNPPAGNMLVIAVLRDDRGGVDVQSVVIP